MPDSQPGIQPLSLTPESVAGRYQVRAAYFEGQIGLKQFRTSQPQYPALHSDPLVIEPERGRYAVLTKFGGVAFWNCPQPLRDEILGAIEKLPGALRLDREVEDEVELHVGQNEDRVTFDAVYLRELTIEQLKLVSLALCESVALDRFEREVVKALQRFEPVIRTLRERGRFNRSERDILRDVGFALEVRAAVLANLTLFEEPLELWESESLARLHASLYEHFDLEERSSAINQKVAFLSDLNDTLMDVLNNNKSHRLEWIIIILIAVEIVFLMVVEL